MLPCKESNRASWAWGRRIEPREGPNRAQQGFNSIMAVGEPIISSRLGCSWNILFTFYYKLGPEPSMLCPDPFQTLNYGLQLRSVKFSASGIRQVSISNISNTQDWVYIMYIQNRSGPKPSILVPDPPQSLNNKLQFRSVQF